MKIINTKFNNLKLIEANFFADKRGYLREIYKKKILKKDLVFHYFAKSKKNVFRGFHFQTKNQQEKLVTVLEGSIIDICIDLRKNLKHLVKSSKYYYLKKIRNPFLFQKGLLMDICH